MVKNKAKEPVIYTDVCDAIEDGLFEESDILVFWGKRGRGKSSLQAMFNVNFMQPKNAKIDVEKSKSVCELLNQAGYASLRPPEDHLVFVDTFVESKGFGLVETTAYETDFYKFGLPMGPHKPFLVVPYGKYSFDEIQDAVDSHEGPLPTFSSKGFELSRHPRLFIMLAMQRPMRLPKDVRDLATFIECVERKNIYNDFGKLLGTLWTCNIIYDNANLESYLSTHDESLVDKQVQFYFEGNIYACYDPWYFLPAWYKGMENQMPVYERCQKVEFTEMSFKNYHERHKEPPEYWRSKKTTQKEKADGTRKRKAA